MGTNVSEAARKAFFSGRDEDATAEMSCSGGLIGIGEKYVLVV